MERNIFKNSFNITPIRWLLFKKIKPQKITSVMVNFLCQLTRAMRSPDANMILGVSEVFLDVINIWISRVNKADCPS